MGTTELLAPLARLPQLPASADAATLTDKVSQKTDSAFPGLGSLQNT